MDIEYVNNKQLGPGHGYLRVKDATLSPGPYSLSLQRSADKCFLNADGTWQDTSTSINLNGRLAPSDTALCLDLKPCVVNALSTNDTYRLQLVNLDQGAPSFNLRLRISEIIYTQEAAAGHAVWKDTDLIDPKTGMELPIEDPIPRSAQPVTQEVSPPLNLEPDNKQTDRRSGTFKWVILLLACLLLGFLGYFVWDTWLAKKDVKPPIESSNPKADTSQPQPKPIVQSQTQEPPTAQAQSQPKPTVPPQQNKEQPLSLEAQVHNFFTTQERSPAQAAQLVQKLQPHSVAEQDAIFRLYYFAATHGDTSMSMAYAKCLDPVHPNWGTIQKNALEAYKIYTQLNTPAAQTAQKTLRQWLQQEHAKGNKHASQWLQQLPK
ncbi:MAG: hypothetical protein IJU79_00705 [Desulfovibrionaceae bacterium]|nr:hypothetical protein [Desulfovibrionaceae bacterium]